MVKNKKPKNLLFKMLLRSIKINYKQFLSIIGISFLAICLFTGTIANANVIEKRVDKLYEDSNMADIFLYYNKIDQNDYNFLDTITEISSYEERLLINGSINEYNININIKNDPCISKPVIREGEKGFLVSKVLCEKLEVKIGDVIYLKVSNVLKDYFENVDLSLFVKENEHDVLNDDQLVIPIKITGYMYHAEGVQNSEFNTSLAHMEEDYFKDVIESYLRTSYKDSFVNNLLNQINENLIANQIIIKTDNVDLVSNKIDEYYKLSNNLLLSTKLDNLQSNVEVMNDVQQARSLTVVFPTFFFFVSALVIATTLGQMIFKERTLIGTMKAIGLNKKEIMVHYFTYGAVLCLIGTILGMILGPIIIPNVMDIKYNLLWELPHVRINFFYPEYIICVLVLLGISSIVSYFCCYKEVNLLPVESMRPAKPKPMKKANFKGSLSIKMSLRNIKANISKSLMVIIGIMGCTGLLVCSFGILDTLDYCLENDFVDLLSPDLLVRYDVTELKSHKDELMEIDGIKQVEEVLTYPIKIQTDHVEDTMINLIDNDNSMLKTDYKGEGITLTSSLASSLKVKVGDKVTLIINGITYERRVDQIFVASYLKGVYDEQLNFEGINLPPAQVWVKVEDGVSPDLIKEKIEELEITQDVSTYNENLDYANSLISNVAMMTNVIKIFAIALAVVVIYNLSSLNMNERIRDIATMKVLGFNKMEIAKSLIYESLILTVVGGALGLALGFPIVILVMSINKTNLVNFLYHVYFKTYVISMLITLVTSLIINLILVLRANKIKMIESLKSVE